MKKDPVTYQRRPFLTPIWLTAVAAFIAFTFVVALGWIWATAGSTTVVVIRHAEKVLDAGVNDPVLTVAGQARAELLARMFGDSNGLGRLQAIYVSPALRNRQTGAPLAQRLGIQETVAPAGDPVTGGPRTLARRVLREHRGGRVLIVGHSDTVAQIVEELSGRKDIPDIGDDEYGTMYIVTVPRIGHANLLRLHY